MITKRYRNEPYSGPAIKLVAEFLSPNQNLIFETKEEAERILKLLDTKGQNFQVREFFPAPPKKEEKE
jgi:hypothetical protein